MKSSNEYILHLDFGANGILKDPNNIEKTHKDTNPELMYIWTGHPEFVNQRVVDIIESVGLFILAIDVFKLVPENDTWVVHSDVGLWDRQEDSVKINWIYGNQQSPMIFYKPIDPSKYEIRTLPLFTTFIADPVLKQITEQGKTDSKYVYYDHNNVEEIYQGLVGFPSLVQSGVPHTVRLIGEEPRYCISAIIGDKSEPFKPATFSNAASKLQQYWLQ